LSDDIILTSIESQSVAQILDDTDQEGEVALAALKVPPFNHMQNHIDAIFTVVEKWSASLSSHEVIIRGVSLPDEYCSKPSSPSDLRRRR
jgi:hypothetical protein